MKTDINQEARIAAEVGMQIPGQMRQTELAFLYRLARQKGPIVEIGCLHGRSTAVLVQAASKFDAQVTSVDPFFLTPNTMISSAEFWRENLAGVGLAAPDLMAMMSVDAAEQYEEKIGLLFVDGNHRYEDVAADIEAWTPKVKRGGLIAFHDMFQPAIPGVAQAVTEWWTREFAPDGMAKWKLEGLVDFLIVFRKVAYEG